MREWGAALIHARNTGCWHDAIVAAMLTPQVRLVLGFHGLETTEGFTRRQRCVALCGRLAGGRFTSVSQAGRLQLHRQARVPPDRVDLLPNGVDLRRFDRPDQSSRRQLRDQLRLDDAAFVVGTVGALTPVKQQTTLIAAAARASETLPDIQLLIVGDGPLRASLTDQARLAGLADRVRFLGWREDVPALLGCMDAYVCASASEGMSNALLEAMAAGLPIIATDVGDNATLVRNDVEGCIVIPNAPAAIAEALRFLAGTPAVRARYAAAARARASLYGFGRTVHAYEAYYNALLGTGGTVPARSINRARCTVST
jgi:glycosyltransferase involved in cell wall biosynthesis